MAYNINKIGGKMPKKLVLFLSVFVIFSGLVFSLPSFIFADSKSDVSKFVTRFYSTCLDRGPDAAGLDGWTTFLLSGQMSGADVAKGFIFSPEFVSRNVSDERFLNIMYFSFFNRAPDPIGFNGWLSLLKNGRSREIVFAGFINSQEFANLCTSYGIRSGASNAIISTNVNNHLSIQSSHIVESEILAIINSHRSRSGYPILNATHALNSIARTRSLDMMTKNYFSHTAPNGTNVFTLLASNSIPYLAAGENIYQSFPPSTGTAQAAVSLWLSSPLHSANMLNPHYANVGINVADSSTRRVITIVFTN
jgi:uncharacterized protein YkwD